MKSIRTASLSHPAPPIHLCIALEPEDSDLPSRAAMGNAEAQNDLATICMQQNQGSSAMYWFEQAAEQGYAESMHWLGRCHLEGRFVEENANLGIMWIAKAAAHGHVISQAQIKAMIAALIATR